MRWGILSTGHIAAQFARGLAASETGTLVAVGSRNEESARAFADEHGAANAHGSYDALLADPDVDVVYIATPHPWHKEWAIAAANAGKHILCEKPLGMNAAEVETMLEAARANDVFLMEAFMYRCHPQTDKILELVRSGALGEIHRVQASFGFKAIYNPEGRLFSRELGGGGILDIGCYPVSFARLIAGAACGKPFLDPVGLEAQGTLGEQTGVDHSASALLSFEGGVQAQVSCSVDHFQDNHARIYGAEAWLEVPWPWCPAKFGGDFSMRLHRPVRGGEETVELIEMHDPRPIYTIEADTVARDVAMHESSVMSFADSFGNARTLDRWRLAIGLKYPADSSC